MNDKNKTKRTNASEPCIRDFVSLRPRVSVCVSCDSDMMSHIVLELHWLCIRWWFSHSFRVWIVYMTTVGSVVLVLLLLLSQVNWIFFLTEIDRFHYERQFYSVHYTLTSTSTYCFFFSFRENGSGNKNP